MSANWTTHIADARGRLKPWRGSIEAAIARTHQRVNDRVAIEQLDIVVQDSARVIPERGHVGFAPNGWIVYLSFDPDAEAFESNLGAPLERTLAHEINHILRWRGPGYGATLGEALISEGLAGVFVRDLYASPPEPWEQAVDDTGDFADQVMAGWDQAYDHAEWFFGTGQYPVWAGYTLGYQIVAHHVDHATEDIVGLTTRPASDFKTSARLALQ
ncbi:hypothetical protein GCM10007385_07900 [Tateyamaria omphalii]|uniref:DUF2268 domain-containing putative Zn-dependent protease n=1 Tax=Tateyamaria omphalii TaxID=299262 RepID=UPI00167AFF11|nr:DUF2268 domain-containing putative Zn-dependent protease [Tateyamaria omphalii]GGX42591.1 hypothetical protein GCM10007385_07900 [Tateyamaria omphalii]